MRLRVAPLLLLALWAVGCPELQPAAVPVVCGKAYEKCKLPSGPLGVCDRRPCPPGEAEPCLVCVPQH